MGVRVQVWEKNDGAIGHLRRSLAAYVVYEDRRDSLAGFLPLGVAEDTLEALRVVEKEIIVLSAVGLPR